ncbi:LysM peptidoglycan-binding domain-containing protein [Rossellomorea sp. YZS02]|uniref:LysM peptidoglycan-binding domain-containing protein n=1 Tax=Rossellomorea sp. YZS02 TaxID=3097358 RepID=UPI002A0E046A|nr:LysM peptidoglycan-binding domain-containing protein [Rossellomorea sp. YZS02]MDX8343151.1 LysM peptidoglycan-binding domain-containing protein [Rossellomorea sp. YZS02]
MKKAIVTVTTTAILSSGFIAHASASTHKVESGESLWSISKKYNTNVNDLKALNNLSKDVIFPNQVLKIVQTSSMPQIKPKEDLPTSGTVSTKSYEVKSGDTLGKIAKLFSLSISDLMNRNNLTSHLIFPGQKLIVSNRSTPETNESSSPIAQQTATYTVTPGDTLSHISVRFGMTIQQIKDLNGLKNDTIYIGQQLKTGRNDGNPPKEEPTVPVDPTESKKYTVQPGDSLSAIGNRFNVSLHDLKTWNNLTSDRILAGQVLSIGSSIDPPTPGTGSQNSTDVLTQAKMLLGTPYLWGGTTPAGFDCSGFIYYVHKQAGQSLKRYSSEGYYSRSYYVDSPKPGDLVFFENTYKKGISHLGIYLGDNQFIHAGDNGVEITSLSGSYWSSKFDGFKRLY